MGYLAWVAFWISAVADASGVNRAARRRQVLAAATPAGRPVLALLFALEDALLRELNRLADDMQVEGARAPRAFPEEAVRRTLGPLMVSERRAAGRPRGWCW